MLVCWAIQSVSRAAIMISSDHCQSKAEECARLARDVKMLQMRVTLSNAERTWIRLAAQCERLEAFAKAMEERHPVSSRRLG